MSRYCFRNIRRCNTDKVRIRKVYRRFKSQRLGSEVRITYSFVFDFKKSSNSKLHNVRDMMSLWDIGEEQNPWSDHCWLLDFRIPKLLNRLTVQDISCIWQKIYMHLRIELVEGKSITVWLLSLCLSSCNFRGTRNLKIHAVVARTLENQSGLCVVCCRSAGLGLHTRSQSKNKM